MWAMLKFEWNRMWHNKTMLIACGIAAAIIILDFAQCFKDAQQNNDRSVYRS